MQRAELELAREHIRLFAAGDIDGLTELYRPDAVVGGPEGWPEGTRFEGREEGMRQFARIQEERSAHAEGRASGAPLEMHVVAAYRFVDGLIAEARHYWRFDEALADLGLER